MEVIAHQAIREHPPPITLRHLPQDLEEPLPVAIVPKHQRALVPTHNEMEDTTCMLDPRRTHHHPNLAPKQATIYGWGRIVTNPAHRRNGDRRAERRRPD